EVVKDFSIDLFSLRNDKKSCLAVSKKLLSILRIFNHYKNSLMPRKKVVCRLMQYLTQSPKKQQSVQIISTQGVLR
ncbi:hypothetical protein PYS53_002620, partial [Acinetobacter baumannii]